MKNSHRKRRSPNVRVLRWTPGVRRRLREDPDNEKEGMTDEMGGVTRCRVQYKRASTDLHRWGEPDRDVYVRKW